MNKKTIGTVIAVKKQTWLKVNRKALRANALDGAEFPHIVKVEYTIDDKTYIKRKFIPAGTPTPAIGSEVIVSYNVEKPSKGTIIWV